MVRKTLRERLDLPRLMATSSSQMSLIVWDEQYTESEAMSATTGTDLTVSSVFNAPSKTNIHFQQDRITHSDVSKYGRQLPGNPNYSKLHVSARSEELDTLRDLIPSDSLGDPTWVTVRMFVSADISNSTLDANDVQSMYADKTDVFNLETDKFMSITSGNIRFSDIAIFGTNVVFLEDTDEIIANTDLEGSDVIYSSRLLEIEDELVTA